VTTSFVGKSPSIVVIDPSTTQIFCCRYSIWWRILLVRQNLWFYL